MSNIYSAVRQMFKMSLLKLLEIVSGC